MARATPPCRPPSEPPPEAEPSPWADLDAMPDETDLGELFRDWHPCCRPHHRPRPEERPGPV